MKPVSGFLFSSLAASFLPGGANPITCLGQIFPFFLKIWRLPQRNQEVIFPSVILNLKKLRPVKEQGYRFP
jgi:hypothetical protein